MNESLSLKQLNQISAYLDDRLNPLEKQQVEQELQRNLLFKQTFTELEYTRRMLRTLPKKRAPRNYTLSPERVKAPARRGWLQPAMGFVSAAAALAVVVLFVGTSLLPRLGAAKMAPSQEAALQAEAPAAKDSSRAAVEPTSTPQIFLWNSGANGMGGGGGGAEGSGLATGMGGAAEPYGIGGGPAATTSPTEEPSLSAEALATANPDTLILGLPSADTAGEIIPTAEEQAPLRRAPLGTIAWLEIILGAVALAAGAVSYILFRRR